MKALFRVGLSETGADPSNASNALKSLAHRGMREVPYPLGVGRVEGATWSLESVLTGRRPPRLSLAVTEQIAAFCASLPREDGPAEAFSVDFATIAAHLPGLRDRLEGVRARFSPAVNGLGSVARHGDLWAGNVLVVADELTGVVDWDAWSARGVPGTDLLNACSYSGAEGSGLGRRFLRRPWRQVPFTHVAPSYWRALETAVRDDELDAVGVAWWGAQVAANLNRLPHLAQRDAWVSANVVDVLTSLGD